MIDQEWPEFLDKLDSDPDNAFADFYKIALRVLKSTPPVPMRSLPSDDIEELTNDIVYHCVKDNFRILRQYKPMGKPFAAWFYIIATNKCRDYFRSRGRRPQTISIHGSANELSLENKLRNPGNNGEKKYDLKKLLSFTRVSIEKLGDYCRLLLEMAADEFTPREMVAVLRLPKDHNKKVSDDLRECRRKLKKLLVDEGYDIKSLLAV